MPRKTDLAEKIARLRVFYRNEKRLPCYREMLKLFNYNSKKAVFDLVAKLVTHGYLQKKHRKLASTAKLHGNIKLLGNVQAGFPSPAEEELIDSISLDEFLVSRPEATFMPKVTGDSMIEAGIHPGDMLLVEKGGTPALNDIIVAQVDGEWTLKYFGRDSKGVYLDPANRKYRRIRPARSLVIGGIVNAVVRKYH